MNFQRTTIGTRIFPAIAAAVGIAVASASMLYTTGAQAHAPQVKSQAPGYYRMMLGEFEVTALSDGTVTIPLDKLLVGIDSADMQRMLAAGNLLPQAETSINAYLINTGKQLVLIDTGAGKFFGPAIGGHLVRNLRAAGYAPEQIDLVLLTHIHGDHSGGLSADGKAVFPNALVRVDKHESDFWLDAGNAKKAMPSQAHGFTDAADSLAPYIASGRLQPFESGSEILPGIKAISAAGHTPGHSLYEVQSMGRKMMFLGDIVHAKDVQLARPEIAITFDVSEREAVAERKKLLARLADTDTWVAGDHIAFPGIGRVRKQQSGGYLWAPVNYSLLGLDAR